MKADIVRSMCKVTWRNSCLRGTAIIAMAVPLFLPAAEWNVPQSAGDFKVPLGLAPVQWPKDNPYSQARWELGRDLYFDPRLSADATVSCATCHDPAKAFTDNLPFSKGIRGQQ